LQARAQHVQATQVAHRAAKWNQLPDLSVGIGRKEADTDLSGWVWKADLEIPLWGQRRSERHLARVEHERAAAVYRAAQLEAEQDARAAFAEWSSLSEAALLTESFGREDAEVSVNRGIELHASGEFSAAELVDALRSSLDALAANLDLQTALLSANLKLRFVTGLPILEE